MVAELTGIASASANREGRSQFGSRKKKQAKWISTAIREPIYSVLEAEDELAGYAPIGNNVVIIRAVTESRDSARTQECNSLQEDTNYSIEDKDCLYSVVNKKLKKNKSESDIALPEDLIEPEISENSGVNLKEWLGDSRSMYRNEFQSPDGPLNSEVTVWDMERPIALPRGVLDLVSPYRVYGDLVQKKEPAIHEEEDKVIRETQYVAPQVREENVVAVQRHLRAKWKISEDDDTGTLVSEVRDIPENESEIVDQPEKSSESTWKAVSDTTETVQVSEWMARKLTHDDGVLSGKEERAIDVPEFICKRASNEQPDKDSLNEVGSTAGGNVEGAPGGSSLPGRGERINENETMVPPRSLVSRILARTRSPDNLLDHSEPFSQLWIVLSNVYGELVVVLMMALCLAEVMDTPVPLLSLQGVFLMYLYVGSIAVIISIYIWVLVDSCGSLSNSGRGAMGLEDAELGGASLTRFGSLKRAHISRARTAPTSFYIRVGALLFGLATLVFNGLEMAMHSMMQGAECLSDVVFVHPVLHGLFTFLQMHFLFVNSQVLVERFGLVARFGFTHLAATNIAIWVRLVIWDSAQEWTYFVHLAQRGVHNTASPLNLRGFPGSLTRHSRDTIDDAISDAKVFRPYQPISDEQISQVVALQECVNTNTLGQLWTSSMPFLYPFIVQFSLIAAAVTFVMGRNVGKSRYLHKHKFHNSKDLTSHTKVGCDGSSKGLFLGILCMVAGIVVILIFLVVREDDNFPPATLSWLTCGTLIGILMLSSLMTATGLVQIRQMSVVSRAPSVLDNLLSNVALFGVQLYSVFTLVVCACSLAMLEEDTEGIQARHIMLLTTSVLQLIQCYGQSTLIAEALKRSCITRFQMMGKPGRQVITFLLFSNAVLWAFDTVVTQNWISQELQLSFFGVLTWGILSRLGLPLLIFYRFHSCVLLLEAWNKCYRTPRGEHPLN